jgi:hypothetical protein
MASQLVMRYTRHPGPQGMNRILASIVALILIALIWMLVRIDAPPREGATSEATASSARAGAADSRLATESAKGGDRTQEARSIAEPPPSASGARSVRVASSTGLALAFVELEVEPRTWQRRDLADGWCALDQVRVPCGVRAPGHVAATIEKLGAIVTLEPDALLELDGEHLKECVPTIGLYRDWIKGSNADEVAGEIAAMSTFGFVDEQRWLVAVDADRIGRWFPDDKEVEIDLAWRDHRMGVIEFVATHGVRGRWDVPCQDVAETAPLDVTFVRPADATAGEIEAMITTAATIVEQPAIVEQDWGRVQLNPRSLTHVEARVPRDTSQAHWDGIPLGRQLFLRARDLASGAFGCMTFTHDGTARTLTLRPGVVVTGRIAVPEGSAPPVKARVYWAGTAEGARNATWNGLSDVAFADDRFEVRGWANVPSRDDDCNALPTKLQVTVICAGFRSATTQHDVDASGHCECGEIALQPMIPQFVLAPGHGIADDAIDHQSLRISTQPLRMFIDVGGRSLPDGSFALYLHAGKPAKKGPDANVQETFWASSPTDSGDVPLSAAQGEPIPALLLDLHDGVGIAFRRADDGRYERVRDREHSIDVECSAPPHDGRKWTLGWSWLGMRQRVDSLGADAVGERRRITFRAPESGVSAWWSATGGATTSATEGGTIDLGNDATTIHVP